MYENPLSSKQYQQVHVLINIYQKMPDASSSPVPTFSNSSPIEPPALDEGFVRARKEGLRTQWNELSALVANYYGAYLSNRKHALGCFNDIQYGDNPDEKPGKRVEGREEAQCDCRKLLRIIETYGPIPPERVAVKIPDAMLWWRLIG